MFNIPGYQIEEHLHNGQICTIFKATDAQTDQPVVIKVLDTKFADYEDLCNLRHQQEIALELAGPGFPKPLELHCLPSCHALVMEQASGFPLSSLILESYFEMQPVEKKLQLAIDITKLLQTVHEKNIAHLHLEPRHFIFDLKTSQVSLIDFSSSSKMFDSQGLPPGLLTMVLQAGDLAAPEQLGMIHRSIDERADMFQVCCMFYQIFAGRSPFPVKGQPMARLTQKPSPLQEWNPRLPEPLYRIIHKGMSYDPNLRYQSMKGLLFDLEAYCDQPTTDMPRRRVCRERCAIC